MKKINNNRVKKITFFILPNKLNVYDIEHLN